MPPRSPSTFQFTGLGPRITAVLIVVSLVLSFVSAGAKTYFDYNRDLNVVIGELQIIEEQFLPELEWALSQADEPLIESVLNGIAAQADVINVNLQTETGGLWERTSGAVPAKHIERAFALQARSETVAQTPLGALTVTLTLNHLADRAVSGFVTHLVFDSIKALVTGLALLWVFHRWVSQPLRALTAEVGEQGLVQGAAPLSPYGSGAQDELEDLVQALNSARNAWARGAGDRHGGSSELPIRVRQLREANQEQSDFTYAVSHDLKAPVNTMAMLINEIESAQPFEETGQAILADMRTINSRMGQLVSDVRRYASVVGHQEKVTQVDLSSVLDETLESFADVIKDLNATVTSEVLPVISGRKDQLGILIGNLLSNAFKFRHPNRTPHISISCSEQDDAAHISIQDNGIGVKEMYREEVFGLFKRLHTHAEYEGSGLGLAMSRRVMSSHAGWISLTQAPGGGSIVTLSFPKLGLARRDANRLSD